MNPLISNSSIVISVPLLRVYGSESIESFFIKYYLEQTPEIFSDMLKGTLKEFYFFEKISGACFAFKMQNYPYDYLFDPLFHK